MAVSVLPRRRLMLLCAIVAASLAVMLAGASTASPILICPVTAGPGVICCGPPIVCCGPPVVQASITPVVQPGTCCPGTALCVQILTIATAPNPSSAAQSVVISGQMPNGSVAVTAVDLWQRLPGQSQFHKLLEQSTDGSGAYSITETPATNRQWYVTAGGLRSATVDQQVQALVTLKVHRTSGRSVTLTGAVSPSHARERVLLETGSGNNWTVIARPRLDRHSRFHVRFHTLSRRSGALRAVLPGDSRNMQSVSATVPIPRH